MSAYHVSLFFTMLSIYLHKRLVGEIGLYFMERLASLPGFAIGITTVCHLDFGKKKIMTINPLLVIIL